MDSEAVQRQSNIEKFMNNKQDAMLQKHVWVPDKKVN